MQLSLLFDLMVEDLDDGLRRAREGVRVRSGSLEERTILLYLAITNHCLRDQDWRGWRILVTRWIGLWWFLEIGMLLFVLELVCIGIVVEISVVRPVGRLRIDEGIRGSKS